MYAWHGWSRTKVYAVWKAMRQRCNNPRNDEYHNYGGRGIKVCARWDAGFMNFLEDMGPCPKGMTLERKNNDLGYSKRNCAWVGHETQSNNRRGLNYVTISGVTRTATAWARINGIRPAIVLQRINAYGWSAKVAVTTPAFPRGGSGPARRLQRT